MTEESLEDKKERMRRYMKADRKLEDLEDKRARRGRVGCIGGLIRLLLVVGVIAGIIWAIWLWHPWETQIEVVSAADRPGTCSPGVDGTHTEEHLAIFGVRVWKTGESTICKE